MDKKPNWLVRNIRFISISIALYPWFGLLLVHLTNNGLAAFFGYLKVSFLSSIANLIISTIIIISAKHSKQQIRSSAISYFFYMNSIAPVWMILMLIIS